MLISGIVFGAEKKHWDNILLFSIFSVVYNSWFFSSVNASLLLHVMKILIRCDTSKFGVQPSIYKSKRKPAFFSSFLCQTLGKHCPI